jgi:hypothetical protein
MEIPVEVLLAIIYATIKHQMVLQMVFLAAKVLMDHQLVRNGQVAPVSAHQHLLPAQ